MHLYIAFIVLQYFTSKENQKMRHQFIGKRIRTLRKERRLSQEDLAKLVGFNDRQTISAIETGERRVNADELILFIEKFEKPLKFFTDPFLLVGDGEFCWRRTTADGKTLKEFEWRAGRWIAAYRYYLPKFRQNLPLFRPTLYLDRKSRFEDAVKAGEQLAVEFNFSSVPATDLINTMERDLGILVLMVDAPKGISGASCRLPDLDAVIIARREAIGHRHFNLAHELFHVLTWNAMPPQYTEEVDETGGNRVEQLANYFASAILLPEQVVKKFGMWPEANEAELIAKIIQVAEQLRVSPSDLMWRLVTLGELKKATASKLSCKLVQKNKDQTNVEDILPPLYSKPFVEILGPAIDAGLLSARRASKLLEMQIEELVNLFHSHGLESPFDL